MHVSTDPSCRTVSGLLSAIVSLTRSQEKWWRWRSRPAWGFTCYKRRVPAKQEKILFGRVAKFAPSMRGNQVVDGILPASGTSADSPIPQSGKPPQRSISRPQHTGADGVARLLRFFPREKRADTGMGPLGGLVRPACCNSRPLAEVLRTPTYQDRDTACGFLSFLSDADTDSAPQPQ